MEPEDLDEADLRTSAGVETRGGDRPVGWKFPEYDDEGTFPHLDED